MVDLEDVSHKLGETALGGVGVVHEVVQLVVGARVGAQGPDGATHVSDVHCVHLEISCP